jgi:parallel beta-helix repeat protein
VQGDDSGSVVNGVVISNNLFQGSGPSDGIQITGDAYGTVIGPGNEFVGIKQSGCGSTHCDPIQFYGASHTTITGNYIHGNSTGLLLGVMDNILIQNNVLVTDGEYPDQIVIFVCGNKNNVIRHNTLANGANIRFQDDGCGPTVSETAYDNVVTGRIRADATMNMATATIGYNLTPVTLAGTNNLVGRPTYVGGSSPSTLAGYQLASNSLGYRSASDGTDRGNNFGTGTGTALPPPQNLRVLTTAN